MCSVLIADNWQVTTTKYWAPGRMPEQWQAHQINVANSRNEMDNGSLQTVHLSTQGLDRAAACTAHLSIS